MTTPYKRAETRLQALTALAGAGGGLAVSAYPCVVMLQCSQPEKLDAWLRDTEQTFLLPRARARVTPTALLAQMAPESWMWAGQTRLAPGALPQEAGLWGLDMSDAFFSFRLAGTTAARLFTLMFDILPPLGPDWHGFQTLAGPYPVQFVGHAEHWVLYVPTSYAESFALFLSKKVQTLEALLDDPTDDPGRGLDSGLWGQTRP